MGPIAQAIGGLTFTSGLTDMPPAGWGYSYMDHHGGYFMAIGILAALTHRKSTGDGQWVDMSCSEAGASLIGPAVLDYTVNGRPSRRDGSPTSNRDDGEWVSLADEISEDWASAEQLSTVAGRLGVEDALDAEIDRWTSGHDHHELAYRLQRYGIPAASVARPSERIDADAATEAWGLWCARALHPGPRRVVPTTGHDEFLRVHTGHQTHLPHVPAGVPPAVRRDRDRGRIYAAAPRP